MAVYAKGCDYAFSHPSLASMKAAGLTFACRYLYPMSQNPGTKNLTRDEATVLNRELEHGVVSNFESWASRALEGHDAGVDDARAAQAQHTACGGKLDRPIYFSVDFDCQPDQYPQIRAYFLGVASVIGLDRTGCYSGYGPIKWLLDSNLIKWGWQTYAWSAGRFDERCQLAQDKNGVSLGGGEIDLDSAHAEDFGQWNWSGVEEDMTPEQSKQLADLWNWFKGASVPTGQANLGSTIAATLPVVQGSYNKVNNLPTTAQVTALLAKIPSEVKLTEEQLAAIAAILAQSSPPVYEGTVNLAPKQS